MSANLQPQQALEFLTYLKEWVGALPVVSAPTLFAHPERAAIVSVDVINGFCAFGPLASPRVNGIVEPSARLIERAWEAGVRNVILTQDTHEPDAVEFSQWPPHCVRGTPEAEAVDRYKAFPFFEQLLQIPKNSIHSGLNTGLNEWIALHPEVDIFVVVGDCTDLCVYQLAMHLRLDANARQLQRRVVLPANCVDTYDLPVAVACEQGILPHPGDLMHEFFLFHMALNGVEVIRAVE